MPFIKEQYKLNVDPKYNLIAGSSLGVNAAMYAALKHSEIFGNVIAQSGGFMYAKTVTQVQAHTEQYMEEGFPEKEWLTKQIALIKKQPLRIKSDAGLLEDVIWIEQMPRFGYPSLLVSNRHLRDVLLAKGYPVFYNEYNGGHESLNWQEYLAQGLVDLIGKNKMNK